MHNSTKTVSTMKNFQRQSFSLINEATFHRFGNQSTNNQVVERRCKTVNARHTRDRIALKFKCLMCHRR